MFKKLSSLIISKFFLSVCSEEYALYSANGCYVDKIDGGVRLNRNSLQLTRALPLLF